MEDDPNFFKDERQLQFLQKLKMTSILSKMEDDLNLFMNKTTSIFSKMEDDPIFLKIGILPQFFFKNGKQPHFC